MQFYAEARSPLAAVGRGENPATGKNNNAAMIRWCLGERAFVVIGLVS